MIKNLYYKTFLKIHLNTSMKRIRYFEKKLYSPSARFAIPFLFRGKGYYKKIEPRQNSVEIEKLYKTVLDLTPKAVLEIGTARGGTLYLWAQAAADDATIVSVDLPGGKFGGAYPAARIQFYQSFARDNQKLHLIRNDSHSTETLGLVQSYFANDYIDFAFIDGDHTYEGVKSDFSLYSPLVRKGGIIALHDILPRTALPDIQVSQFWEEIKGQYNFEEFVGSEGSGRKIGIGLIYI
jgi:predicted O-methyltransferase YrrM